jgi:hypothetical protein
MISASPQIYSSHETKQDERARPREQIRMLDLVQNPLKARDSSGGLAVHVKIILV